MVYAEATEDGPSLASAAPTARGDGDNDDFSCFSGLSGRGGSQGQRCCARGGNGGGLVLASAAPTMLTVRSDGNGACLHDRGDDGATSPASPWRGESKRRLDWCWSRVNLTLMPLLGDSTADWRRRWRWVVGIETCLLFAVEMRVVRRACNDLAAGTAVWRCTG